MQPIRRLIVECPRCGHCFEDRDHPATATCPSCGDDFRFEEAFDSRHGSAFVACTLHLVEPAPKIAGPPALFERWPSPPFVDVGWDEAEAYKRRVEENGGVVSLSYRLNRRGWDVVLDAVPPPGRAGFIVWTRGRLGLDMSAARALVDSAPVTFRAGLPYADAERLKGELEGQGGSASIRFD